MTEKEDKKTKIILEIKKDVTQPKLLKTFNREKETDGWLWTEIVELYDNGRETIIRRTKKKQVIFYPELTLVERQTQERELRKKLDEYYAVPIGQSKQSLETLEKELKIVMGATLKDKVVLQRNFALKTISGGVKQHLDIELVPRDNGTWEFTKQNPSCSFELKDGFPSRIWTRFGTQPWVFDIVYEGTIPEGYKKLINKELSDALSKSKEELSKAKQELETKTLEYETNLVEEKKSLEKLKREIELEEALFEQKIAELLQAVDDAQLKNQIKKLFHINS